MRGKGDAAEIELAVVAAAVEAVLELLPAGDFKIIQLSFFLIPNVLTTGILGQIQHLKYNTYMITVHFVF